MKVLVIFILFPILSYAESSQPYIDELKSKLEPEKKGESYTDEVKKSLPTDQSSEGYTQKLKESLNKSDENPKPSKPYSDEVKSQLEPKEQGGAIKALNEGRSELKMNRAGKIKYAGAIRVGALVNRSIKSGIKDETAFKNMFGTKWQPDFSVVAEFQPFRSETWGNFGFYTSLGIAYFSGYGTFQFELNNPKSGQSFGTSAQTNFKLFILPVSAGGSVRINLAHFLRPYAMVGPAAVGYIQSRDDEKPGHRGYSTGYQGSVGLSILLDWISGSETWDLYDNFSIKHFYLSTEYLLLKATQGPVSFNVSGFYSGFTYEL